MNTDLVRLRRWVVPERLSNSAQNPLAFMSGKVPKPLETGTMSLSHCNVTDFLSVQGVGMGMGGGGAGEGRITPARRNLLVHPGDGPGLLPPEYTEESALWQDRWTEAL